MNYKSFNLGDWISHISGVIEDETTLDGNEMRDLVAFLSKMPKWCEDCPSCGGKGTMKIGRSNYNGHKHGSCSACGMSWME